MHKKLRKGDIAMHCNLRPPDVAPVVVGCSMRASGQNSDIAVRFSEPAFLKESINNLAIRRHFICFHCTHWKAAIKNIFYLNDHVSLVAFRTGMILTKFEVGQPIRSWLITFLLLIRYVMLWPSNVTLWPWTFVVYWLSRDQTLY